MCTVTVIPLAGPNASTSGGFRLACNRDEMRSRAEALPPVERVYGSRHARLPVDPASDGTWIALNDAGLALTLLNVNPVRRDSWGPGGAFVDPGAPRPGPPRGQARSRGEIIPNLLHCSTAEGAAALAADLDPQCYLPFRVVCCDRRDLIDIRSDGNALHTTRRPTSAGAVLFTSSGLGDSLVQPPREALFAAWSSHPWTADRQDAFHRLTDPEEGHLGVCMTRIDARTVSFTSIQVDKTVCELSYLPGPPGEAADESATYHSVRS
jgi:Transport and Golgi organisation 2